MHAVQVTAALMEFGAAGTRRSASADSSGQPGIGSSSSPVEGVQAPRDASGDDWGHVLCCALTHQAQTVAIMAFWPPATGTDTAGTAGTTSSSAASPAAATASITAAPTAVDQGASRGTSSTDGPADPTAATATATRSPLGCQQGCRPGGRRPLLQVFDSHSWEYGDGLPGGASLVSCGDWQQLLAYLAQRFAQVGGCGERERWVRMEHGNLGPCACAYMCVGWAER